MYLLNNIKNILIPFYKEKKIREIFKILNDKNDINAMMVGGCVRNYLNKEMIGDIDIATIFTPSEIIRKFSNSKYKVIKTGIDHGTITLSRDGTNYEITTLRHDVETDGRHAKVLFTKNWHSDSDRRDFTFNAIYMDHKGKVFDPQNGIKNLREKKVKFIGDPQKRIEEDYLRILRYIRFSIHYQDFNNDEEILKIIKQNLNGITSLSKERMFNELNKIVNLDNFFTILLKKNLLEIFTIIFPECKYLNRFKGIDKNSYKKFIKSEKKLLFPLMLVDNTDNHNYFSYKYKVSNNLKEYLNFFHSNFLSAKQNKNFFNKDLKKNIFYHGKNNMKSLAKFIFINNKKKYLELNQILKKIENTNIPEFPITGKDLLKHGLKSGKKIGEAIKTIEKHWIENNFNLKNDQLKNLLKRYN